MAVDQHERKWMKALRCGDYEAFEHLYQKYYRRLYGFLYRLTWDAGNAEDLLQETFMRLWKRARQFDAAKPLAPYLYRIGKNAWIDFERKRGNVKRGAPSKPTDSDGNINDEVGPRDSSEGGPPSTDSDAGSASSQDSIANDSRITATVSRKQLKLLGESTQSLESGGDAPDARMQKLEIEESVKSAMQKLDADKRLVIVLSFYQGLKLREIAEVLEIPIGTVKSRAFHAEKRLRSSLEHLVT